MIKNIVQNITVASNILCAIRKEQNANWQLTSHLKVSGTIAHLLLLHTIHSHTVKCAHQMQWPFNLIRRSENAFTVYCISHRWSPHLLFHFTFFDFTVSLPEEVQAYLPSRNTEQHMVICLSQKRFMRYHIL